MVMFLVDGRAGCTPQDAIIAEQLRKTGKPILLLVNKAEGMARAKVTAEFFELGLGEPLPISSAHGDNVNEVIEIALENFPPEKEQEEDNNHEHPPKIAIVGRPNVGKSTLVNAILGEQRVIAFDQPGTTRDSIYIDFERGGKQYTIIDTAGVRRRGKVEEAVEKFSVIKTMQAIEDANVVVLVVDARDQITEQDAHVADYVLQAGRALVLAVNKWDGLDEHHRDQVKRDIERKLHFLSFAKLHFISALHGNGIPGVLKSVDEAYAAAMAKLSTPKLTRALIGALEKQAAAKGRPLHAQDALRPPGRQQPAADRDTRQRPGRCAGQLYPISGTHLLRDIQAERHAAENPVQLQQESVRGFQTQTAYRGRTAQGASRAYPRTQAVRLNQRAWYPPRVGSD